MDRIGDRTSEDQSKPADKADDLLCDGNPSDAIIVDLDFPEHMPVSAAELDAVERFFGDLLDLVLRGGANGPPSSGKEAGAV